MRSLRNCVHALVLVLTVASGARGSDDEWRKPLRNRNQFLPALLFITLEPERGKVLDKSDRRLGLDFDYSNILVSQSIGEDYLFLDAEYLRADFRFEAGIGRGLELRGSLPFYVMYGGFLDPFISAFHKTLGLPNAGRDRFPDNEFHYVYRRRGETIQERTESVAAVGDTTFQIKKALWDGRDHELAARAAVKLPTGSRDNMTGSGKTDFAVGMLFNRVGERFGGYFNINYAVLGQPDRLETLNPVSLMAAFDWRFKPTWAMVIQYEHLSRFVKSDIPVLDQSGRQLVLGLRWRRSDRYHFEWRFAEDLSTTAPDFTFGFQWTIHWAPKEDEAETPP